MKKIYSIITVCCLFVMTACESELERYPKTEITEKAFFNSVSDLQTYTNGFYGQIGPSYDDYGTDNVTHYTMTNQMQNIVIGNVSSSNVDGWSDWGTLRTLNFFLAHYGNVTIGAQEDIDHYVGITKFFRAKYYYDKVLAYSDVPWYNRPLDADDEALYKACDPRAVVVDSILADIQFAADHVKPALGTKTRISKYSALALMARICLTEGTFRKYHSELNLTSDYTRFLDKAVWACEQIMNSGEFEIPAGSDGTAYGALFNSEKLDGNKEVILQRASSRDLSVGNYSHSVLNYYSGLSRSLMESFLMQDGTLFTDVIGYDTMTYLNVFTNRDPRFAETFAYPNFQDAPTSAPTVTSIKLGGYGQLKFFPRDVALRGGQNNYTSLPIYRLGEVLLIYAEAKAELGTLTQGDLDISVNKLRDRVGMPHMTAPSTVDAKLAAYYPNVSGANQGDILEIRRERRVELSCEGLRDNDLKRWAAGEHFATDADNQGIYVPALGAYDMTGDGTPDLAILQSPSDTAVLASLTQAVKNNLARYYLTTASGVDEGFYLSAGNYGFVSFTAHQQNPRSFVAPKYYYRPIPKQQITLNPNLKQPFGWE